MIIALLQWSRLLEPLSSQTSYAPLTYTLSYLSGHEGGQLILPLSITYTICLSCLVPTAVLHSSAERAISCSKVLLYHIRYFSWT